MTILDQLADHAKERVALAQKKIPQDELRRQAMAMKRGNFAFERALKKGDMAFPCSRNRGGFWGVMPI